MSGTWRALVLYAHVTQRGEVYSFKESFTGAKQDGRNGDVHLVNQALAETLLNDIDTATNTNIPASGRGLRLRQGGSHALGDEVKCCSSFHDKRCAGVVGQHEHQNVIDGIFAPPATPALVWPRSANRPEHVPAENPGPDIPKTSSGKVLINARLSAIVAEQVLLKRSRGESPAMQRSASDAEWVVDILVRAGAETVERYGETFYAKLGHGVSRRCESRQNPACDDRRSRPAARAALSRASDCAVLLGVGLAVSGFSMQREP